MTATEMMLVTDDTITVWADRIRGQMARTVEAIVATGQEIVEAKAAVGHGNWYPLLERIGMGEDTAERFMAIAGNGAFLNPATLRDLPASRTTLATLARLDPDEIVEAVEAGKITPNTTQRQAVEFVKAANGTKKATETTIVYTGNIILDADRDEIHKGQRHLRSDDQVGRKVSCIANVVDALSICPIRPEHIDPAKAAYWLEEIDAAMKELRKFRRMFVDVVAQQGGAA